MVRDQVFEQHEAPFAGRTLDRNETRERLRNLYAREVQLDAVFRRLFHFDGERKREVGDIWERMARVDGERRQHGENGFVERALEGELRLFVEIRNADDLDAVGRELGHQIVVEQAHLREQRRA